MDRLIEARMQKKNRPEWTLTDLHSGDVMEWAGNEVELMRHHSGNKISAEMHNLIGKRVKVMVFLDELGARIRTGEGEYSL